jgi:hypothetical protein
LAVFLWVRDVLRVGEGHEVWSVLAYRRVYRVVLRVV